MLGNAVSGIQEASAKQARRAFVYSVIMFLLTFLFASLTLRFWTFRGDKGRSHLPRGTCLQFLSHMGFGTIVLPRFANFRRMLLIHAVALSATVN